MKPFKLTPFCNSVSEKDFSELIGDEKWAKTKENIYSKSANTCNGCGYVPAHIRLLQVHLNWWDGTDPETAEYYLLCEGCHALKHFEKAVSNNWVVLANSVHTQEDIMIMNRSSGKIRFAMDNHKIILLKKSPEEYLKELQESELNRNDKIKIIFGNKFTWKK